MTRDEADAAAVARGIRRKQLAAEYLRRVLPELVLPRHMSLGWAWWTGVPFAARDCWTYFAQGDDGGPIKIGSTRDDPRKRVATLQTGYPFGRLRVVGVIRGPQRLEREMHERFSALQLTGEWFKARLELVAFIASLPPAQVGAPSKGSGNGLG